MTDNYDDHEFPEVRRAKERQKPCKPRIDVLATPQKHRILALWQDHARTFPPEKQEVIKTLLQELYSMSPEDTEAYFQQLRKEARRKALREKSKAKLKKQFRNRQRRKQKERAYRLFGRLLCQSMKIAFNGNPPPLVSIRLKHMSDVILEQLCELRDVPVPQRSTDDKLGKFLIAVADCFAVVLERIFFLINIKKNLILEDLRAQEILRKAQRDFQEDFAKQAEKEKKMNEAEPEVIEGEIKVEELGEEEEESVQYVQQEL